MLHRREPLEEIKKENGKDEKKKPKEEKKEAEKEEDEAKPEEGETPFLSREEEARKLREIGADELADQLVGQPEGNPEDDLCAKCKKKPSRLCKECGCQVSLKRCYIWSKRPKASVLCFALHYLDRYDIISFLGVWIKGKSRDPIILRRMPILYAHELFGSPIGRDPRRRFLLPTLQVS